MAIFKITTMQNGRKTKVFTKAPDKSMARKNLDRFIRDTPILIKSNMSVKSIEKLDRDLTSKEKSLLI